MKHLIDLIEYSRFFFQLSDFGNLFQDVPADNILSLTNNMKHFNKISFTL